MKFYLISLGCPKNLTNSEEFSARLLASGHELVFSPEEADTVIINTCGFISSAVKEGTAEIRRALELKKEGKIKRVAVTGCMVDRYKDKMAKDFPEADLVFSIAAQEHIEDIIGQNGLFLESLANALYIPEYKMSL
ncbi:MAG TPA: 30S ribosomal protein S12 methylthiotransferase RimO, partial [Elusimicrobia bacterium]|nr:30S ribosomal protein S12 methylthiotransferase RimO [Elusimicrobiota bacterium]